MKFIKWILLSLGCLVLLLTACPVGARPLVVASIFPLYELAKDVGSPQADIRLLLPPGADPHSWEPSPKDLLFITRADVLLVVGHGLEPWFEDLEKALRQKKQHLLIASKGAPLRFLGQGQHSIDPHIWLDFKWDAVLAQRLGELLAQVDPGHADFYRHQACQTAKRFEALDQAYRQGLASCRCRKLVLAGHAAFGYLARAYNLQMIALAGLSPEAEPTPQALAKIIKLIRKEGITAIFYEHPTTKRFAQIIAQETGVSMFYLNSGASLSQEEYEKGLGFFDLMEINLRHLRKGLMCR